MYFPSNFPVCDVGLVRNSIDKLNCLLKTLTMSLRLMYVVSLKVMELLSCCGGRLWACPCIVFQ